MYKSKIIVFEGIEGSGKTFHLNIVSKYLKRKKIKFLKLREPGGSSSSEKIRSLILSKKSKFHKLTDLFLYLAARNENLHNLIKKNLKKKIIIIDRFTDSTIAYQHYGMGIDIKLIKRLNQVILKKIKPNFTFLHLVNMKNLNKRVNKRRKNRYDSFNNKFYTKVQNGFIKISKNKKDYLIIDSNKNIIDNKKIILKKINNIINI